MLRSSAIGLLALCAAGAAGAADLKGSRDHPAVPRYEGAEIVEYTQKAYDEATLVVRRVTLAREPGSLMSAEGQVTRIRYRAPPGRSGLEIFRNYQAALREAGFAPLYACEKQDCGSAAEYTAWRNRGSGVPYYSAFTRKADGLRAYVYVAGDLSGKDGPRSEIEVLVVEPKAMERRIEVVSATGIERDVAAQGRAVLYAIQFDLDKATLRPESDAQLKEIAGWMGRSKGRVLIVGHTDGKGSFAYNQQLSERRAAAVVQALGSRYKVAAARMQAVGAGMASPIATNRTEDGAARNRRVEVVEIVQ